MAADNFTVSAAEATALRAARPAKAKAPRHGELGLRVLSNRADLISGGDALVEVLFPHRFTDDNVTVTLNGSDVTSAFALRADETFSGLLSGLVLGDNEVVAHSVPTRPEVEDEGAQDGAPDDHEPPGQRAGLRRRAAAAVGLRPAGGDTDRGHDPRHEPDRDRQLAGQRARRPRGRKLQRGAEVHLLVPAGDARSGDLLVHEHRRDAVLRALQPRGATGSGRHRELHERPRRHGQEHRPRRARHDEPRHLRARDVQRPDAAERALGRPEGLERQALLDLRRLERRQPLPDPGEHRRRAGTTPRCDAASWSRPRR